MLYKLFILMRITCLLFIIGKIMSLVISDPYKCKYKNIILLFNIIESIKHKTNK